VSAAADPAMHMQHSMSNSNNGGGAHILLWTGATQGAQPTVTYRDVTADVLPRAQAGGWTLAVGAQDLDGDLRPELYLANDFGPDRLYHNESTPGHVVLRDVTGQLSAGMPKSKTLGHDSFKGMGVDFADLNGDGRTDIFVSNLTSPLGLVENNFAFVNQDDPDLLKQGVAPFRDESTSLGLATSGWSWDAKFGDFDNSGTPQLFQAEGFVKGTTSLWPQVQELALANDWIDSDVRFWPKLGPGTDVSGDQPDKFFVRNSAGQWVDVASTVGLASTTVSRGAATADVLGDGRLDLAVANQWAQSYLFLNKSTDIGRSLELNLLLPPAGQRAPAGGTSIAPGVSLSHPHGPGSVLGSAAVSATATVTLPDGRTMTQQVDGGNGHASVRSPELHFGLGDLPASTSLPVGLTWRDRSGQVHRSTVHLQAGRYTMELGGETS
jgi:hypothetical protein